ncbi:MAG: hypothetical protein A2Y12_18585 [Planctomycetes bacterium GWF2_42_9]|nr:MAG: hypothetical protein A2Y12_18585 [Planctomycetes bacterium GWF2_42_9]
MNKRRYKDSMGFTLVELLVVISIIAILLSVLMPALSKARNQAKMIICGNNMKQVVIAANMYQSENNDYPESIVESYKDGTATSARGRVYNNWTWPARIIYKPAKMASELGFSLPSTASGYVGSYLYKYLKDSHALNCPMAGVGHLNKVYRDGKDRHICTYNDMYESGNGDYLSCSYSLWWNYFAFDYDNTYNGISTRFAGPGKKSRSGLLITDTVIFGDKTISGNAEGTTWAVTHPFKGADLRSSFVFHTFSDPAQKLLKTSKLVINAGFADGRVSRYAINELIEEYSKSATHVKMYIPKDFK